MAWKRRAVVKKEPIEEPETKKLKPNGKKQTIVFKDFFNLFLIVLPCKYDF